MIYLTSMDHNTTDVEVEETFQNIQAPELPELFGH